MTYFPQNVFKNITSHFKPLYPTRAHPVARMMEAQLGVWMLAMRYTPDDNLYERTKLFQDFFAPRAPLANPHDPSAVYLQRHAGARRGITDYRPRFWPHRNGVIQSFDTRPVDAGAGAPYGSLFLHTTHFAGCEFQPNCRTIKDMKAYLKANGFKGYSKKKKDELIKMLLSF